MEGSSWHDYCENNGNSSVVLLQVFVDLLSVFFCWSLAQDVENFIKHARSRFTKCTGVLL